MAMSSVLEQSPVDASPVAEESPYLFTADEFYRLLESKFFPPEARVGLWEGRIYEKMAKTQAHAVASINAIMTLTRVLPPGWCLSGENPFTVSQNKAPLPDLIVLRGRGNDYIDRRTEAADVGLVIEFSLTRLKFDTGSKLESYARAGVSAYWVLNFKDNVIHIYESPITEEGRFASVVTVALGGSFPFTLDGAQVCLIAASDLLPVR
jgi:Uma2 family endonuclease